MLGSLPLAACPASSTGTCACKLPLSIGCFPSNTLCPQGLNLYESVALRLVAHNRRLYDHLHRLVPSGDNRVSIAIAHLVEDSDVFRLFAGLLPLETALFVFDTCILASVNSSNSKALIFVLTALINSCKADLLRSSSVSDVV